MEPAQLAQLLANGVVIGSILTLAAVGLTLVYGILHLANFAHGDLMTLGAYLGLFFTAQIPAGQLGAWSVGASVLLLAAVAADRAAPRLPAGPDRPALSATEHGASVAVVGILAALHAGWILDLGWMGGWMLALALAAAAAGTLWTLRERLDRPRRTAAAAAGGAIALALLHRIAAATVLDPGLGAWGWTAALVLVPAASLAFVLDPESLSEGPALLGLAAAAVVAAGALGSRFVLGVVLAVVVAMAFSALTDLVIWRYLRAREAGLLTLIIASIGLALALRNAISLKWGSDIQTYEGPVTQAKPVLGTSVTMTPTEITVVLVSLAAILVVHLLLRHSRIGTAMRALSDNEELARITGIDVDRVILYVWLIAGGLAALAGVMLGNLRSFTPSLGWLLLLPIFASVILGGIGSPYGAIAGGMVIGIAMEVSPAFGVPTQYKSAVGFVILITVLMVRPQGIFGGQATR